MANKLILGAVLTLALIFSPGMAQSVPTKIAKKKNSPSKTQKTQHKSSKKKRLASRSKRSRRSVHRSHKRVQRSHRHKTPVRADMTGMGEARSHKRSRYGISETPPLMKVIPQRDGRFLLEPLSPKKNTRPLSRTSSAAPEKVASSERHYNRFEPWDFSELVLALARHYQHAPYARGCSLATSSATDCSGFVQFIYHGFKINLPRSSREQAQVGKVVTRNMDFSKLLPGDLLFFRRGGHHIGHAGIYLGEGKMIHASNYRYGVTITDLRQPYYEGTFVVAKRVFEVKYPQ